MENKSVRIVQRKEYREIHIQSVPLPGESPADFAARTTETLDTAQANIVRATFFGKTEKKDPILKCFEECTQQAKFPVTWIEGEPCNDSFISGVYIFAVAGVEVRRLYLNGQVAGSFYQTSQADFCHIGGLYSDPSLDPSRQTTGILESSESVLNQAGMSFENTVRTWYYLDDILSWYNDFNKSRTAFFNKHGIFNKLVPASTGISGKNNSGSKIGFELTAIKPKDSGYIISRVKSPLQCSAEDYGSSFSRAVKYSDDEYTNLTVSGTASIDPEGKTAHLSDIKSQIKLSFDVVKAILYSQNLDFSDIVRSYAYVNDKSFAEAFYEYIKSDLPVDFAFICAQNRICRDGLLFEIELDLVKKRDSVPK